MTDDLERTIAASLDHHARRLGSHPEAHLDGVWEHLDRRRNRRRGVAAMGSALAIGLGVAGIAVVGAPDDVAEQAGAPITTLTGVAWRCTGLFGDDGFYRYYSDCTPVAELPPLGSGVVVPSTLGAPTLPTVVESGPPATTGPAGTLPSTTVSPPARLPLVTTTTTTTTTTPTTTTTTTSIVPAATTAPTVMVTQYVVEAGDSLSSIAAAYGVDVERIVGENGWPDGLDHPIFPGDLILVPLSPAVTAPPTLPSRSDVPGATWQVCEDTAGDVPVTIPCPAGTTAPLPMATAAPAPPSSSFRCAGLLGVDAGFEYLRACDTIGPDGAVEPAPPGPGTVIPVAPSTMPPAPTAPPTTAPDVPVPAATAPPTSLGPDGSLQLFHVIGQGENPSLVARLYGITVDDLVAANDRTVMETFLVGATLVIPASDGTVPPPMTVPSLVGLTEGQARARIDEAQLAIVVEYLELPPGDAQAGTVVEQELPPGAAAGPGQPILVWIGEARQP